jgi:AraC-like DNA-binding protein
VLILSGNNQFTPQNYTNNSNRNYALELKEKLDSYEYIQKDISEIYQLFPLSPTTLIKSFRELTGMTIVRYSTLKKIEYIKSLLVYTRYSILQISSLAGYDSLSYMISTFKKEVGVTPSIFRKNNL